MRLEIRSEGQEPGPPPGEESPDRGGIPAGDSVAKLRAVELDDILRAGQEQALAKGGRHQPWPLDLAGLR